MLWFMLKTRERTDKAALWGTERSLLRKVTPEKGEVEEKEGRERNE